MAEKVTRQHERIQKKINQHRNLMLITTAGSAIFGALTGFLVFRR